MKHVRYFFNIMNDIFLGKNMARVMLFIALFITIIINCPHQPYANLLGDPTISYAPAIESEYITDWHSALFLQECVWLKKILFAWGWKPTGVEVLMVAWYFSAAILLFVGLYFVLGAFKTIKNYELFLVILSILLVMNILGFVCYLYLDFHFSAVMALILFIIYISYQQRHDRKKVVLFSLVLLLLFYQMIELRKNALLLMPFLLALELRALLPRVKKYYIGLIAIVLTMGLFYVYNQVTTRFIRDQQTYPAAVMMASDMCIASTYRGDIIDKCEIMRRDTGYEIRTQRYYDTCIPFNMYPVEKYNKENWDALKSMYLEDWENHFSSMLAAKVIQAVKFYTAGYTPGFMVNLYENLYDLEGGMALSVQPLTLKHGIRVVTWLLLATISATYACYSLWRYTRKELFSTDKLVCVISCIGWLYAGSFLVVTPTPDGRYRSFSIYLFCLVTAYAVTKVFALIYQRKQNKKATLC